jgi:UDP-hydrolysing UDP-N-acetyl-D-glucosamine 2-epimerase
VINSRANYARVKTVMKACQQNSSLEIFLIVGASAVLYRFGKVSEIIESDGFILEAKVYSVLEGDTPRNMAATTGISIIELSSHFERIKPDIVVTIADRYETLGTAIAASYMNIPLAHIQGGEITGSIDESVRHACTKLAHLHFPASEEARKVLIQLGELESSIYLTGCPAMDLCKQLPKQPFDEVMKKYRGVGFEIDAKEKFLLVSQHPVTNEHKNSRLQIMETLEAIVRSKMQTIWLWPNVDSGSDQISKRIRQRREQKQLTNVCFYKNFSAEDYVNLLRKCLCIVGNSSSGIREAAFLGVPSVNIGDRQTQREQASNVINTNYDRDEISAAIKKQISRRRYDSSDLFGKGDAGDKMVEKMVEWDLDVKKLFYEVK